MLLASYSSLFSVVHHLHGLFVLNFQVISNFGEVWHGFPAGLDGAGARNSMTTALITHKTLNNQSANFVIMEVHKVSSLLPYTHLSIGDCAAALVSFRCIDKGFRQPNAKFHIVVAASPFPTSWWLLSLSASFTGTITKVAKTAWPASRVHYPSWSYRVNEGSLGTSYVNNFTEDWRWICGGTVPTFFFKLFLTLGDSQVCTAPESRDEIRLRLAHAHLLRGQARNSVTSRQIAIASGAERRNPHPHPTGSSPVLKHTQQQRI